MPPQKSTTPEERRKLTQLSARMRQNQHELTVLDVNGLIAFWYGNRLKSGMSIVDAREELRGKLEEWNLAEFWPRCSDWASLTATYTATALDLKLLTTLAVDLRRGGDLFTKYRISYYGGKAYIIFKGSHRARQVLTGTRYLAVNTKIASLGIGKLGAAKAIAGGMKITIVLTIGFRGIETLMKEEATWHYFVGSSASDIVKVAISGAASFIAASLVAAGAATGVVAAGPLFVAIIVGVGVGMGLEAIDERIGFTAGLIDGLRKAEASVDRSIQQVQTEWNWHHRSPEATVQFWMRVFGASY